MSIRTTLDTYLDRFNMHRVTLAALLGMALWAVVMGAAGVVPYSPVDIVAAVAMATAVAVAVNTICARVLHATTEVQSSVITALILVMIMPPGLLDNWAFLSGAAAVSSASKYVVAADKQHVFNPAAVALVALGLLFPELAASWWIGTPAMLPAVAVFGGLVVIKTRRTGVVLAFLGVYALVMSVAVAADTRSAGVVADAWRASLGHTALLFFAFIMMTDPVTVPSHRLVRPAYVSFVALLYVTPELYFIPFGLAPEQALCLGNAVSFAIRPKYRLSLPLRRKSKVGADTWAFQFGPRPQMAFAPGQYMEWTVPHPKPDGRGQRRYFTIASSPAEKDLTIVMRVPDKPSSFKRALLTAGEGSPVIAARLAGDFVLPHDLKKPLAFIAGGVGVAPFRSMTQHVLDTGKKCDVVMLYSNRRADEVLFNETFGKAEGRGLRTVYVLTDEAAAPHDWKGRLGRIDGELIRQEIPDYKMRTFYISGSQAMVHATETELRGLGVPGMRVRKDYFDGATDT
jgi:ferredoxin-NADP reductase/Na+-translocating ferredoxin:NAD+ oxidoreductase RnfD subunit